jgi:hypothetical protein
MGIAKSYQYLLGKGTSPMTYTKPYNLYADKRIGIDLACLLHILLTGCAVAWLSPSLQEKAGALAEMETKLLQFGEIVRL